MSETAVLEVDGGDDVRGDSDSVTVKRARVDQNVGTIVLVLNSQQETSFPLIYTIPRHKLTDEHIAVLNNSTPSILADYLGIIPGYTDAGGFDKRIWTCIQYDESKDWQPILSIDKCTIIVAWRDE